MAVLLYAVEVEILENLATPDRDKFLTDAAEAYRARGRCLQAAGRPAAAEVDWKRAEKLEAEARKLATKAVGGDGAVAQTRLTNGWTAPVTVVVEGVPYTLQPGEQKVLATRSGTLAYEIQTPRERTTGRLEAGRAYTVRPPTQ